MESLRHYLAVTLVILLGMAGGASAQVPSMAARSLSLASPPNAAVPFASLTTPSIVPQINGTLTYCSDCKQTTVCAAGGGGALAELVNNAWQCGLGTSTGGTASINPGSAGQVGGYAANGTVISPLTSIQATSVNGVLNVTAYGAKGDGATDNTTAINNAVAALGPNGGTISFPSAAGTYKFASKIVMPKNVMLQCAGDSAVLQYTGTSAALVWSDATVNSYRQGGWNNCVLEGPGIGSTAIGIYLGGDPTDVITNHANYGDFMTFIAGKVEGFGTGFQMGNNVWEDRFYSTIFTGDGIGYYIPNNIVQPGENMSIIGGAIQNSHNAVICNNQNADIVFTNTSFDGIGPGPVVQAGNVTGSQQGCGVTLQNDHIEYFGNSVASPVFSAWGLTPFTNIKVLGGAIQFDDTGPGFTIPAIADLNGGGNTVGFELDGPRISSNGALIFTNTCKLQSGEMCISGDDAVAQAIVPKYGYWDSAGHANAGPSHQWGPVTVPSTTGNTDTYGAAVFDSPVFIARVAIAYSSPGAPTCTAYPAFYVRDATTGINSGSCPAVAGRTSCVLGLGAQAMYIHAGDQVAVGTASPATGCTASTNFYVTLEYRP